MIDGGAEHAREAVITLEGRLGAEFADPGFCDSLKIERSRARLYVVAHEFEHFANYFARAAHLLDLLRRLQYNSHKNSFQFSVFSSQFGRFSCKPHNRRLLF
jgi:hypothetical protein